MSSDSYIGHKSLEHFTEDCCRYGHKMLNCYYNLEKDEGKVHVSGCEHSFKVRIEGLKQGFSTSALFTLLDR